MVFLCKFPRNLNCKLLGDLSFSKTLDAYLDYESCAFLLAISVCLLQFVYHLLTWYFFFLLSDHGQV